MQHPWLADNGVASDQPLENEIQQRLQKFQGLNKLKRQALRLVASYMLPNEVEGLRNQFLAIDKDKNGANALADGARGAHMRPWRRHRRLAPPRPCATRHRCD